MQKSREPLIASADVDLVAEARRLAAAAGVGVEIASDAEVALRGWLAAPLVLVGADLAAEIARQTPSRRPSVHLLGHRPLETESFRHAVSLGATSVAELPESEGWLLELLADLADGAGGGGIRIGVLGGAGGVGASVFAAALARRAADRAPSVVVDLDLLGVGVDRLLGLERRPGTRWDGLSHAAGRLSARSLRDALPVDRELSVLAFGAARPAQLPAFAVREALAACGRAFAVTVVDLPRWTDEALAEVIVGCDLLTVVATRSALAVRSARHLIDRLPPQVPVGLLLRRDGVGMPSTEVAQFVRAPVLHEMGPQRGLEEALALGAGPLRGRRSTLARAADDILDAAHDRVRPAAHRNAA